MHGNSAPDGQDVAVVIVTYKSADLTIRCLRSIHAEKCSGSLKIRVVVVDNASGDYAQIDDFIRGQQWNEWITLLLAPKNGGFAYGNNLGIRAVYAQGRVDYIHLLNPDTLVRKGGIAALVEFLAAHPGIGIGGSSFETEEGAAWPIAFRFPSLLGEFEHGVQIGIVTRLLSRWTVARKMTDEAQPVDWVSGASMMIRSEVFETIGCLDENFFLYFEETEFCHRARKAGFATWYVPKSRVMHAIGKSTNVNDGNRFKKRLPGYWFDSRTRYHLTTAGSRWAALIDVVTITSSAVGLLKSMLLRRDSTPHYIRDLLSHSALRRRNRRVEPLMTYLPRGQ